MATKITAIRLNDDTKARLEMLATQENLDMSAVIRNLIHAAAAKFVIVPDINTKPEHDPYVNLPGRSSITMLTVYPAERRAVVSQEYKTNSTTIAEYHGINLSCSVYGHPDEDEIKAYLVSGSGQDLLRAICDGHSVEWNGNNMVGKMTDDAFNAWEELREELHGYTDSKYSYYQIAEWLSDSDVTAETTDAELEMLAVEYSEAAEAESVVLDQEIIRYLTDLRDEMRDE